MFNLIKIKFILLWNINECQFFPCTLFESIDLKSNLHWKDSSLIAKPFFYPKPKKELPRFESLVSNLKELRAKLWNFWNRTWNLSQILFFHVCSFKKRKIPLFFFSLIPSGFSSNFLELQWTPFFRVIKDEFLNPFWGTSFSLPQKNFRLRRNKIIMIKIIFRLCRTARKEKFIIWLMKNKMNSLWFSICTGKKRDQRNQRIILNSRKTCFLLFFHEGSYRMNFFSSKFPFWILPNLMTEFFISELESPKNLRIF